MQIAVIPFLVVLGSASTGAAPTRVPLVAAVERADLAALRSLLKGGADVNGGEPDGTTALHLAARRDDVTAADILLRAGADPNRTNRYGVVPLSVAAANGSHLMIARLLTGGADAAATSTDGETALMTASRTSSVESLRILLAHGAPLGAQEHRRGTTALMWAADAGQPKAVAFLLQAGAGLHERSKGGYSPLLLAVRAGSLESVEILATAGADLNDSAPAGDPNESITIGFAARRAPAFGPDDTGAVRTSALVLAMLNGHFKLATWLVNHGADPNAPDPRGSALHALAWLRKPGLPLDSGAVLVPFGNPESDELARALLDRGARPDVRIAWKEITFDHVGGQVRLPPTIRMGRHWLSFVGATPFWVAAQHSDVLLMRLLLDYGADPNIPAVQNVTPLMAAAGLGFWDAESPAPQNGTPEADTLEAVRICVEHGADVNATTRYGRITVNGDPAELRSRYLFPAELPADAPSYGDMRWDGATALHGAAVRGVNTVAKYLVDHGARLDAKTTLGWTPLMLADHIFTANVERSWPETAAYLRDLMRERGLPTDDQPASPDATAAPGAR
ncbi:MAG: ankyrin repeat domain-containing protein [Acidobacteriota bacterium]